MLLQRFLLFLALQYTTCGLSCWVGNSDDIRTLCLPTPDFLHPYISATRQHFANSYDSLLLRSCPAVFVVKEGG